MSRTKPKIIHAAALLITAALIGLVAYFIYGALKGFVS